jgi:ribosomal-protein-alanine N-acetyltransferase
MVKVRRFNPNNDLVQIAQIANRNLGEDYKFSMFVNVSEAWPDGFLVAESMGTYIGTIITVLIDTDVARILVLAVEPDYRRQGIGEKLLNSFIQKATLRGVRKLTLEVRMSNKEAISFYNKHRFKMVSTIPVYYRDGEGAYVMERTI